jgi:trk system potassium uptake protein
VAIVSLLVVVGGVGYVAWFEVLDRLRGRATTLGVTAKMVLVGTAVVLPVSMVLLAITEWHNAATLAPLSGAERLGHLATLAVMPRSAGFDLTDTAALTDATKLIVTVLMYLGAGPASTGGGIKLTGTAVLALAMWAAVRGHAQVGTGRWQLERGVITLATAVAVLIAATAVTLAVVLSHGGASYGDALFDAMSATTTTGLSTGAIATSSSGARWATMVAMLIGRLGPMLVAVRLSTPRTDVLQPPTRRPLIS